ncbi:L7Ae/L30e/S12e/Gadd45 family ribosomal protein [Guggenheimella bovis]
MNKVLGFLGIARKAQCVVFGYDNVTEKIKRKRAHLILLASDASDNSRRAILNQSQEIPVIERFSSFELSSAIGSKRTVVLCVTDKKFAAALLEKINEEVLND